MIKDHDRVMQLLNIVEKTSGAVPGFTHIISDAMAELREINEGLRKQKEVEQGKPVTPAPVEGGSTPTEAEVDSQTNSKLTPTRRI